MSYQKKQKPSSTSTVVDLSESPSKSSPSTLVSVTRTKENSLDFYTLRYLQRENENLLDYKLKLMELISEHETIMIRDLRDYKHSIAEYNEQTRFYEQLWGESNTAIRQLTEVLDELKHELRNRGELDIVRRLDGEDEREE